MSRIVSEFALIQQLQKIFGKPPKGVLGIGDDAAVFPAPKNRNLVWTTDSHVENIHFRRAWLTPLEIGHRAAAAALSDLAAMGAAPTYGLLTFELPSSEKLKDVLDVARGVRNLFRKSGAFVIGGNITKSPTLALQISALGETIPGRAFLRSGARAGDDVYVSGVPGLSALALHFLRMGKRKPSGIEPILRAWRRPLPRFDLVSALGGLVHSAIDLSDGLLSDARHIAEESRVHVEIDPRQLPTPAWLFTILRKHRVSWEDIRLEASDDYELLFTAPQRHRKRLKSLLKQQVQLIGQVTHKKGIKVHTINCGWDHFR